MKAANQMVLHTIEAGSTPALPTKSCPRCRLRPCHRGWNYCRSCNALNTKERYWRHHDAAKRRVTDGFASKRKLVTDAKRTPCSDCGVKYPPYVMDFDHARGEKVFELCTAVHRSVAEIIAEIAKCDVVCANCHRERTHQRRSAWHQLEVA